MELEFRILIEPKTAPVVENAVTFEAGATREQAADTDLFVYEHHGEGFGQADPGALTSFFEDLILGRPLPLVFVTPALRDIDTLFAIALFLHRDLAIAPAMTGLVGQVDLVHRRGLQILGHVDPDLARFFRLLRGFFTEGLPKSEMAERMTTAVGWIREYVLEGKLPALGRPFSDVRVLDRGTNGFVVAETNGDFLEGWVGLYAKGYLRGVLVRQEKNGRRCVVASRKSYFVQFDLETAARLLNDVETAMGEPPGWNVKGDWLWGPEAGTQLMVEHMLQVFLRV